MLVVIPYILFVMSNHLQWNTLCRHVTITTGICIVLEFFICGRKIVYTIIQLMCTGAKGFKLCLLIKYTVINLKLIFLNVICYLWWIFQWILIHHCSFIYRYIMWKLLVPDFIICIAFKIQDPVFLFWNYIPCSRCIILLKTTSIWI